MVVWRTEIAPQTLTDFDCANSMILIIRACRLSYVSGALSHVGFGRCVALPRDDG
jgi:hypothetical protein